MILEIEMDEDIRSWLKEDLPYWDLSHDSTTAVNKSGKIIAKTSGVIGGITVAKRILSLLDIRFETQFHDGDRIEKGEVLMKLEGEAARILQAERVMLNILSHMSGIASKTYEFVQQLRSENLYTKIAATRKTLPGLRKYQKWAVILGGGDTHRLDLSSMALIKENHIRTAGGVKKAIEAVKKAISFSHKIEIEVTTEDELNEAAEAGVDIIMLDNFSAERIEKLLPEIKQRHPKILFEASGNINKNTFLDYARAGVDIISMGLLTHSVQAFDYSLLLDE